MITDGGCTVVDVMVVLVGTGGGGKQSQGSAMTLEPRIGTETTPTGGAMELIDREQLKLESSACLG